jgi:beta-N-acetylhexosaminidase
VLLDLIQRLTDRRSRLVVVAFGNPYLLAQIPTVPAYLVAWGGFPVSQRAAALALIGANPIQGKLPISIPQGTTFGTGLERPRR